MHKFRSKYSSANPTTRILLSSETFRIQILHKINLQKNIIATSYYGKKCWVPSINTCSSKTFDD